MKTININFDVKSIKNAIKEIKEVQKTMQKEVPQLFLKKCARWIINQAQANLEVSGLGANIIAEINNGWDKNPQPIGNTIIVKNDTMRSVWVEFGIGRVGAENPYDTTKFNADMKDYTYDYESGFKHSDEKGDRWWVFRVDNDADIDVKAEYILSSRTEHPHSVRTEGQPAQLYLYNALMDFVSNKRYKTLWQETLAELIK